MEKDISRRKFITRSIAASVAGGVVSSVAGVPHAEDNKSGVIRGIVERSGERKMRNVLLILGDDHAAHSMGAYGNSAIRTPHLDRLASEGVLFEKAFVNSPVCTPSRQSIITGKYPHATGVTLLTTPLDEEKVTLGDHLKAHGYATGAVGKMHLYTDDFEKHGFDFSVAAGDIARDFALDPPEKPPEDILVKNRQWRPFQDPAQGFWNSAVLPSPTYDKDMLATRFVKKSAEFMKKNRENPFFLITSFTQPHAPFDFPVEYAGKYDPKDIQLPETSPEDDRWMPKYFRDLTKDEIRGVVASYYTAVEYLDAKIGELLQALKDNGLEDNTLVIYIGDNGYLLGHHGRIEKHMMWEEAVRVPLVIRAPGIGKTGQRIRGMVEGIDLAPTILDALNAPAMDGLHGESLLPLIEGETSQGKDFIFSEYIDDNKAMIRTEEWKYVFTSGKQDLQLGYETGFGPSGRDQRLYNLEEDPNEFKDLAEDPKYGTVLEKLRARMLDVFMRTHPRVGELPDGLSTEEKLDWFCDPSEGESERKKAMLGRMGLQKKDAKK